MTRTTPPPGTVPPPVGGRGLRWRGTRILVAGILLTLAAMALTRFPGAVEEWYAASIGPRISRGLSLLTGWLPLSVASVLLAILAGAVIVRSIRGLRRLRAGAPPSRILAAGADWSAGIVGVLLLLFYPLWGLNYARAPIDERLGIVSEAPVEHAPLLALTRLAANRTNSAYRELHGGSDDIGEPTSGLADPVTTSRALESGWARAADALGLGPEAERRHGPVKTLGVTWLIESLDIAGVYVPFTGEANVSGDQPDLSFPAVAAHEQAHQRGLARENEATFAGLVAAVNADDPFVRYSAWARVLRTLRYDLARVDADAWQEIAESILPGVRRDWRDYNEWLRSSRSPAGPVASAANDVYLRAHGVPGGIRSYGRVTTLLLQWAGRYEGDLISPGER